MLAPESGLHVEFHLSKCQAAKNNFKMYFSVLNIGLLEEKKNIIEWDPVTVFNRSHRFAFPSLCSFPPNPPAHGFSVYLYMFSACSLASKTFKMGLRDPPFSGHREKLLRDPGG